MFKQNKKVKTAEDKKTDNKEVKEVINKEQEYLDGWKRCQADFENYKKMQAESQKELAKYAAQNVILDLIPVLDNFHMSTDHIPEDQKNNGWVTGIMHIQKQLENVLKENGVTEIETKIGDKFNPEIHEAVQDSSQKSVDSKQEKSEGQELIKKIVMKGYKLNGKVLRAVRVVVE